MSLVTDHIISLVLVGSMLAAQPPTPGRDAPPGPGSADQRLVQRFDTDKNGWLDAAERVAARVAAVEGRRNQRGRRGGGPGGPGGPGGAPGEQPRVDVPDLAVVVERDTVPVFADRDLFAEDVIRTFFLTLDDPNANQGWRAELADFYRTDVELQATLRVDGNEYRDVGVSYRGNTSFMMVPDTQRRPLGISLDLVHKDQRLHGQKTLNLLNAHTDPSLQRELTYLRICREYLPAPRANFVRVVINGEDWGVHVNVQQMNKDFLAERFGSRKGIRYKAPANFSGDAGLVDLGDDVAAYDRAYELLSEDAKDPWTPLIALCKTLAHASDEDLVARLPGMLDIDAALWFLALDNVFMDDDGYTSRGSDYMLFCDESGRFVLLPHDSNETFRWGGRGPRRGGGDPGAGGPPPAPSGPTRDLFQGSEDERRPLTRRLLGIPQWRAAYVAHVRTLLDTWLRWEALEPALRAHQARLDPYLRVDHHQLYGYRAFVDSLERPAPDSSEAVPARGTPTLREFVDGRRRFLLQHVALQGPAPRLANATISPIVANGDRQRLRARVTVAGEGAAPVRAWLHVRRERHGHDLAIELRDDGQHGDGAADDGVFGGDSDSIKDGRTVFAWIAVYVGEGDGTRAAFHPAAGGGSPLAVLLRKR